MQSNTAAKAHIYQITIEGELGAHWSEWFSGMAVDVDWRESGPPLTRLTGPITDQPALRGMLNRIWDLNLSLVAVSRLDAGNSWTIEPGASKFEREKEEG